MLRITRIPPCFVLMFYYFWFCVYCHSWTFCCTFAPTSPPTLLRSVCVWQRMKCAWLQCILCRMCLMFDIVLCPESVCNGRRTVSIRLSFVQLLSPVLYVLLVQFVQFPCHPSRCLMYSRLCDIFSLVDCACYWCTLLGDSPNRRPASTFVFSLACSVCLLFWLFHHKRLLIT